MSIIKAILCAAGESKRFSGNKLAAKIGSQTLLQRSCAAALSSNVDELYVILGPCSWQQKSSLPQHKKLSSLVFKESRGLGNTIKYGLNHILEQGPCDALLILLADQVLITSSFINKFMKESLDCDYGQGNWGPPSIIPKSEFAHLAHIDDENGAKKIFRIAPQRTHRVYHPMAALDVDYREDLKNILKNPSHLGC